MHEHSVCVMCKSGGVQHVVLALNSGEMARITALMVEIAEKVMPAFRSPGR